MASLLIRRQFDDKNVHILQLADAPSGRLEPVTMLC